MGVVDQIDALAATGAISPQLAASYKAQFAMPQPGDIAPQVSSGAPGIGGASFVGPSSPEPKPTPPPAMMDAKGNFAQGGALPGVIPLAATVAAPAPPDVGTQGWTPGTSAPKTLGAEALTAPGGPYAPPAKAFNPATAAATTNAAAAGYHPPTPHGGFTGGPAAPGPDKSAPGYYLGKAYTPQMQSLMAGQMAATGAMSEAQVQGADAYAEAAGTKATLMQQAQADAERMMVEQNKREAERQTYMTHAMELYEKAANDFGQQKIDPDHYWTSKSAGGSILTVIGLMLGGIGAGATGGVNYAAKIVNDQIDKDIETQKSNIGIGMKALEGKRTMLGDRMKLFGDERMAELSTRAEFWKGVEMKTAVTAASYASKEAQAKGEELVAYAQLQQNQLKQQFEARAEDIVSRHEAALGAAQAAAAAAKAKRNDEVFKADLAAKQEWLKDAQVPGATITLGPGGMPQVVAPVIGSNGQPVMGPDGQPFMQHITPTGKPGADKAIPVSIVTGINAAGEPIYTQSHATPARAKDLDEASRTFVDLKRDIGIVREELGNHPHGAVPIFSADARARADAAVGRARLSMAQLAHLGALSKTDYEQIDAQLPEHPLDVWSNTGATKTKIGEFESHLDSKYKASIETAIPGATPKALPTVAAPPPKSE